jgi:hypothetical protein
VGSALEVVAQVPVSAGAEEVWRAAMDWSRQREWIWATRVSGGHGVGATVTGWTGIGPVGFTDTMVITEWDPPRKCVVRHTGRVVRGAGVFEIIGDGPPCEFRWVEDLDLPLPAVMGALVGLLIRPVAEWGLRASLRRFARLF